MIPVALLMLSLAAIDFDVASSNNINAGSDSTLDNIDPGTMCIWAYLDDVDQQSTFMTKGVAGDGDNHELAPKQAGSGRVDMNISRSGSTMQIRAAATSFTHYGSSKWVFICGVWDTSLSATSQFLYIGDMDSGVAEPSSYSTRTAGSGTKGDDSDKNWMIGGNFATGGFAGAISWVGVWSKQLSVAELNVQRMSPHPTATSALFIWVGYNGLGVQPDWSGNGNAGTVTGGTLTGNSVPLPAIPNWLDTPGLFAAVGGGGMLFDLREWGSLDGLNRGLE